MADEGASSSSNSVDDVDDGTESKTPYSTNFASHPSNDNSCSTVSSSGPMASSSQGLVGLSRLSSNPFAIKTSTPTRSIADTTENKEPRPIVAPPTLKLETSATSSSVVLRPSALAVQAEKLKLMNKNEASSTKQENEGSSSDENILKEAKFTVSEGNGKVFIAGSKQEGKENSSDGSNILKEAKFTVSESNGKISKTELFTSGISTSSDIVVSSSSSTITAENNNSFSLAAAKPSELSSNGGFVFGQNLHERVLNYDANVQEKPALPVAPPNLSFQHTVQKSQEEKIKSLAESAKEYESRQVKRKFDEVTVVTGEEGESNVLQIHCKLFAFDKDKMTWEQRGRGILRLNDREQNGGLVSRVVMRIDGSLRVVLNTKVWDEMAVELPNSKSVRLSAFDPQGVKVFLVMAHPRDAKLLYDSLNWRVTALRTGNLPTGNYSLTVEEPTSSSVLPDDCDTPHKYIRLSDSSCGADSSSESSASVLNSQDSSVEGGCADSTNVQS